MARLAPRHRKQKVTRGEDKEKIMRRSVCEKERKEKVVAVRKVCERDWRGGENEMKSE